MTIYEESTKKRMRKFTTAKISMLVVCCFSTIVFGQADPPLSGFTIQSFDLLVREMVYDSKRNLVYATVGNNGPHANRLVTICPRSAQIVGSLSVGLDPEQLAISSDCERVYIGVNSERSFRVWAPATGSLSPHHPIFAQFDDPAIAEDLKVFPGDSSIVVISADEVGTSISGELVIYNEFGDEICHMHSGNELIFSDENTLITHRFNSSQDIRKHHFDGQTLTFIDSINSNEIGTGFELIGTGIVSTNGVVFDPDSLHLLGTFPTFGNPEWIELDDTVYFFSGATLRLFDRNTFLQVDSISTGFAGSNSRNLVHAGENRLAVSSGNQAGIIYNVPATSKNIDSQLGDVNGDCEINLEDIAPFVDILISKTYLFEADINQDFIVDLMDVQPFVQALSK